MPVPQPLIEIAAQHGAGLRLVRGQILRIIAVEAEQVADLALFDASDLRDSFSPGRTIDYNESLDVGIGALLYSHRSAELAEVVEDTAGVHDLLLAPCSRVMFARREEHEHRSCHENLYTSLAQFGLTADNVLATLNVFMDVRVGADRKISIHPPASKRDDRFTIRALRDLVVGVAACSSELTNAGACKPVAYELLR